MYAYAKSGVLTRATYPDDDVSDRGFVSFHFDSVLRLTRTNHADDTNTDTVYDSMGRRLTVTRGTEVDSFTYTVAGQLASAKRGTSGTPDATSEVERLYDDLLRLTRESQTVKQGTARHIDYAYDLGGSIVTRTYPDATAFSYNYTDVDQLDTLKRGATTLASYSYVGYRPAELTLPTGTAHAVVQRHAYDGMGRLTRLSQARNGTELATFDYSFDDASNVTKKSFAHRSGTPSEDYTYDTLHRLTRTTFGHRTSTPYEGFVYDHLGNHLTQDDDGTTIAGSFNDANEQTDRGANSLTWSLRGNLTEDDAGQQYAYDRSNLLTEVKDDADAVVATYAYDALGRRIEKDVAGGDTTQFYYDGNRLIEERDDAGVLQRQYVWGGVYLDELLLFTDVIGAGGTADADLLALRHHNFNIVALVDRSDGSVAERYDYNPYGERTVLNADFTDHSDATAGSFAFAIGHQGLLHDHESGLVYNRARMLHMTLGRFVQRDPWGYVDGMSVYAAYHVFGMGVDPSGLSKESLEAEIGPTFSHTGANGCECKYEHYMKIKYDGTDVRFPFGAGPGTVGQISRYILQVLRRSRIPAARVIARTVNGILGATTAGKGYQAYDARYTFESTITVNMRGGSCPPSKDCEDCLNDGDVWAEWTDPDAYKNEIYVLDVEYSDRSPNGFYPDSNSANDEGVKTVVGSTLDFYDYLKDPG